MNRRKFLKLAGGGIIIAAGGATAGFITTRAPTKALQPWADAATLYTEPRKRALSYAILAPNPHNRQPWLVDLSQKDEVFLFVDPEKMLPHTDPFNRQITIGLGCFLEILRMAAAEDGNRVMIEAFPEGFNDRKLDQRPVARVRFLGDTKLEKDTLFGHILARRSNKEAFDTERRIPDELLEKLSSAGLNGVLVSGTNEPATIHSLRRLTHEALEVELHTPRANKESIDLVRIGKSQIEANPDGISLSGAKFEMLKAAGLMSLEDALDPATSTFQQTLQRLLAKSDTAMGYLWLVTKTNSRLDQLKAGRAYIRVNLAATALGLGIHPLSQALQEYAEMKPLFDRCHSQLASEGGTVQMLARLGYAAPVDPSPRWPLDVKIIKS